MRVVIMSVGTTGDIFPYTGVAARLAEAGHEVVFAVPDVYRAPIERNGYAVRTVDADVRALLNAGPGPGRERNSRGLGFANAFLDMVRRSSEVMVGAFDSMLAAASGADVLLVSYGVAVQGYLIAKALGIPSMGLYMLPVTPTREFAPALFGGHSFGPLGNKLVGPLGLRPVSMASDWVRIYQRRLSQPASSLAAVEQEMRKVGWPIRYGYSAAVVPRPADWPDCVDVVGYWWTRLQSDWEPSAELVNFVSAGSAPVLVTLGSLGEDGDGRLARVFGEALRLAGVRGVMQSGAAGLSTADDHVIAVGNVDYEWLMPRVSAVVHRASAGTAAAALRAGVPAVSLPMAFDNSFWARRLVGIGVSPGFVPLKDVRADRLGYLIGRAVHDSSLHERAAAIAGAMAKEDGAGRVLHDLDRIGAK